jgi:ABC-type antimicrobial peptide transport system permease subunit
VYFVSTQVPTGESQTFAVRTDVAMTALAPVIRDSLSQLDAGLRLTDLQSMTDHVARSLVRERMLAALAGFFASVAVLLCAIGIYGLLTYQVSTRRREIGIRMALGADGNVVVRSIVLQAATLTLAGCVIGVIGSLVLSQAVEGFLFGVGRNDPVTLMTTMASLTLVAIASAWPPGRRAARTDPAQTLRAQ